MPQWPAQPQTRPTGPHAASPAPPPLSAPIRRHLGSRLRTLYDSLPVEPVDARIAALLAQLDKSTA